MTNAERPLLAWYREVLKKDWDTPAKEGEVPQRQHRWWQPGGLQHQGNDYRLVVRISYPARIVCVRLVGAHAGYDAIDVEEVSNSE